MDFRAEPPRNLQIPERKFRSVNSNSIRLVHSAGGFAIVHVVAPQLLDPDHARRVPERVVEKPQFSLRALGSLTPCAQ